MYIYYRMIIYTYNDLRDGGALAPTAQPDPRAPPKQTHRQITCKITIWVCIYIYIYIYAHMFICLYEQAIGPSAPPRAIEANDQRLI